MKGHLTSWQCRLYYKEVIYSVLIYLTIQTFAKLAINLRIFVTVEHLILNIFSLADDQCLG
jgi:hypothetical protein